VIINSCMSQESLSHHQQRLSNIFNHKMLMINHFAQQDKGRAIFFQVFFAQAKPSVLTLAVCIPYFDPIVVLFLNDSLQQDTYAFKCFCDGNAVRACQHSSFRTPASSMPTEVSADATLYSLVLTLCSR